MNHKLKPRDIRELCDKSTTTDLLEIQKATRSNELIQEIERRILDEGETREEILDFLVNIA